VCCRRTVLDPRAERGDSMIDAAVGASDAHDAGDFGGDWEPTGLAYTDDAADYPPLPRNYADVKVGISDAGKAKPRRYTNEDHQVWGHTLDGG